MTSRRPASPLLRYALLLLAMSCALPPPALAQFRGRRSLEDRGTVPQWEVDPAFAHDVFSFARLRYTSYRGGGWGGWGGWRGRGQWATDAPDADLNLLFRLQQMTSMKVNPNVTYIDITPEQLSQYPFVYMIEPGSLEFTPDEVTALREYLLNGGFLMVDDFWGEVEWENFRYEIGRVFPDREPVELEIDHPIFHCVFDLKEKPQMPSIHHFLSGGVTYEREDAKEVHYKGIFDDRGRLMVIICHNTDLGDGWEREGEDPTYFERFSEKMAYPMAINILFYAMTN